MDGVMGVYTILLVDDEDDIRGRIAKKIECVEGFKVIGSASNGYDALDFIEESPPDIVVTDIKMPFIDGIELTQIIRKSYPTIKVGIISGYDDSCYLKDAINLDVVAYLSKPITKKRVKDFLDKVKNILDTENEHIRLKENMQMRQIRDRVINLCLNDYKLLTQDKEMLEKVEIRLKNPYVCFSTRLINSESCIVKRERKQNQCFLMLEEMVNEEFNGYHIIYKQNIISIVEVWGQDFDKKLDMLLYKLTQYLKKYLSVEIAIGVSEKDTFMNLSKIYRQSQIILEQHEVTNHSLINYFKDMDLQMETKVLTIEEIQEFKTNIKYMDEKYLEGYLCNIVNQIKIDSTYDYFSVIMALSGAFMEYANSMGMKQCSFDINTIKTFIDSKNIEGFIEVIKDLVVIVRGEMISQKSKKTVQIMDSIIMYLETNFNNPNMSMDFVCDKFNISVSYLSTLFKKQTDTTFNKYLVSLRIEHAKLLIKNTDDKMVTIAEKCGYKDVYYFSHSFKKTTGKSPKEYRRYEVG